MGGMAVLVVEGRARVSEGILRHFAVESRAVPLVCAAIVWAVRALNGEGASLNDRACEYRFVLNANVRFVRRRHRVVKTKQAVCRRTAGESSARVRATAL